MGNSLVDNYTICFLSFDNDKFIDEGSASTIWKAYNSNAKINTVNNKFGTGCLELDGTSYIYTDDSSRLGLGSGDLTLDMWVYKRSAGHQTIMDSSTFYAFGMAIGDDYVRAIASNDESFIHDFKYTLALNEWHHLAFIRKGITMYFFVDGKIIEKFSTSYNFRTGAQLIGINADRRSYAFNGYIDDFRISNIARWTEDFNPEITNPKRTLYYLNQY
jgi:hypothetical protein